MDRDPSKSLSFRGSVGLIGSYQGANQFVLTAEVWSTLAHPDL